MARTRIAPPRAITADWTQVHAPAANTQATCTQAAAGPETRNVCTGLTVTLAAGATAPTAGTLTVALIDGDSGGSVALWKTVIAVTATAGSQVTIARSGLWVQGSPNTAMTLEFSDAGGGNTLESVAMEGTTEI